jgi:hypothetical protein
LDRSTGNDFAVGGVCGQRSRSFALAAAGIGRWVRVNLRGLDGRPILIGNLIYPRLAA